MTQVEIDNIKVNLLNYITSHNFALFFDEIKPLLSNLQKWWAISRTEEVESLYIQMLRYSTGNINDPNRTNLIKKIKKDLYFLVDDVVEAIAIEKRELDVYIKKSNNSITLDSIVSQIYTLHKDNNDNSYSVETMAMLDNLFNAIWLSDRLSTEDETILISLINDDSLIDIARSLIFSALTLKSQRIYDRAILHIAIYNINNADITIRVRAQVLLVSILAKYSYLIDVESEDERSKINSVMSDDNLISELLLVIKCAINTLDTEKVTRMIERDIMPEMMKQSDELRKMITNDDTDNFDLNTNDTNPKWKSLFDDANLTDKLNEFQDLQKNGADIHMGTFSKMKSYPFFSKTSNWFLPFDKRVNDIAAATENMPDIFKLFIESPQMCSSDKYSFFLSIAYMGSFANFDNAMFKDSDILEQAKDELTPEKWKSSNHSDYNAILKCYIQDIYRYYNINTKSLEQSNLLMNIVTFTSQKSFIGYFTSLDDLHKICSLLFEKEAWYESLVLFEYLEDKGINNHFFYQQMGYVYQQQSNYEKALRCYERAEVIESNDVWILKSKAVCYKKLNDIKSAIVCYNAILQLNSNNISAVFSLANCYMQMGDYEKARALYFKADYLSPDTTKIQQALAWCLYMEGDYSRALDIYRILLSLDKVDNVDALNGGHTYLALGDYKNAVSCYTMLYIGLQSKSLFVSMINDDIEYIMNAGLSKEDISLMIDQVLMDVEF